MAKVLKVVSFGSAKGGLATVGYTVYGIDGAVIATRSTDGVVEIGTNTGFYAAPIDMPDYDAIVLWDTGEGSPKYATESYQYGVDAIRGNTERMEQIWNKLKNYDLTFSTFLDKLGWLQKNEGLQKVSDKVDAISQKENPSLANIEEVFNRSIKNIKLDIPQFNQIDYSGLLGAVKAEIKSLAQEISRLPKTQKEYTPNLNFLANQGAKLESLITEKLASKIDTYAGGVKLLNQKLTDITSLLAGVLSKLEGLDGNDKNILASKTDITKEIKTILTFLQRLALTQTDTSILAAFGHKR